MSETGMLGPALFTDPHLALLWSASKERDSGIHALWHQENITKKGKMALNIVIELYDEGVRASL